MAVSTLTSGATAPHALPESNSVSSEPGLDDAWIAAHYDRIHRAAWLMTGDACEAEDLAQEVFVIAIDRWDRFDGRSSADTWLYGILLRLARRRTRTLARLRNRVQQYVARQQPAESSDPQVELAQRQWRESIWRDVAKLPDKQREAILLRFAEEMTFEDIGQAVGCPTGTAKTRVHHGLKRLRLRFDARPIDPADTPSVSFGTAPK